MYKPSMVNQTQPLVYIVIPTWNRQQDLAECLASVKKLVYSNKQVLIVDNNSTDNTIQMVTELYPEAKIITLAENLGAASSANIGFTYALEKGAHYILRLDSDTVLTPTFLDHLVTAAEQNHQSGILVGKIYYYEDPSRIWSLGAYKKSWDLGAQEIARNQIDSSEYSDEREIDYAWSTGMLLTRHALIATNGFDPAFFVYYEEADLCCRIKEAGFQIRSIPKAHMWHKLGQSSRSSWVAFQWNRSKMIFFRKHSKGVHKLSLIIYAYLYSIWRGIFPKETGGNRGPMISALRGLTAGLFFPLHTTKK